MWRINDLNSLSPWGLRNHWGVRVLEPDREQPRVEPYLVQYGITSQLFGGVLEVRIAALVSKLADIASHTC